MDVRAVGLAETDRYDRAVSDIGWHGWPRFMHATPVGDRWWGELFRTWRATQAVLLVDGEPAGAVHSIPIRWDGSVDDLPDRGWDAGLTRAAEDWHAGVEPNTLQALAITLPAERRGQGLAAHGVAALRAIARGHGFSAVIACVRPSMKAQYPLTPFERYVRWTTEAGEPFDPWMRVHARAGARVAKPVAVSMEIPGTVAEWEEWTGLRFPESGRYVVPGALVPVDVDVDADRVVYREPNVWMIHDM